MQTTIEQLRHAMTALEVQRPVLGDAAVDAALEGLLQRIGDAVVEPAIAALRQQVAALEAQATADPTPTLGIAGLQPPLEP